MKNRQQNLRVTYRSCEICQRHWTRKVFSKYVAIYLCVARQQLQKLSIIQFAWNIVEYVYVLRYVLLLLVFFEFKHILHLELRIKNTNICIQLALTLSKRIELCIFMKIVRQSGSNIIEQIFNKLITNSLCLFSK